MLVENLLKRSLFFHFIILVGLGVFALIVEQYVDSKWAFFIFAALSALAGIIHGTVNALPKNAVNVWDLLFISVALLFVFLDAEVRRERAKIYSDYVEKLETSEWLRSHEEILLKIFADSNKFLGEIRETARLLTAEQLDERKKAVTNANECSAIETFRQSGKAESEPDAKVELAGNCFTPVEAIDHRINQLTKFSSVSNASDLLSTVNDASSSSVAEQISAKIFGSYDLRFYRMLDLALSEEANYGSLLKSAEDSVAEAGLAYRQLHSPKISERETGEQASDNFHGFIWPILLVFAVSFKFATVDLWAIDFESQ